MWVNFITANDVLGGCGLTCFKASVFLLFNRRPEISRKKSNICKEVVKEAGDPSKTRVVSSAY